jgi:hypothetical protein
MDCLVRDGYRCFRCGKPLASSGQWNCHHRLFDGDGGPDTAENRITLCGFGNILHDADGNELCHGWVHHHKKTAMPDGWAISKHATQPPELIPVRHWERGMVLLTADLQIIELREEAGPDAIGQEAGDQ